MTTAATTAATVVVVVLMVAAATAAAATAVVVVEAVAAEWCIATSTIERIRSPKNFFIVPALARSLLCLSFPLSFSLSRSFTRTCIYMCDAYASCLYISVRVRERYVCNLRRAFVCDV